LGLSSSSKPATSARTSWQFSAMDIAYGPTATTSNFVKLEPLKKQDLLEDFNR
jgi:hypothetical protein